MLTIFVALIYALSASATLLSREFAHLIIPLKQDFPTTPFGTDFWGEILVDRNGIHQIFTEILFDVPSKAATYCTLNFTIATATPTSPGAPWRLFPDLPPDALPLEPYTFNISSLATYPNATRDSFGTHPAIVDHVATVAIYHAGVRAVTGGQVPCAKGQAVGFLLHPADTAREWGLRWFEYASPVSGITYEMWG